MTAVKVEFEPIEREANSQTVAARISGVADGSFRLWYRIPIDHKIDDLARAHAFAVSTILQAMAVGRDLVLDGPLTRGLAANLDEYQRVWTTWMPEKFRRVELRPRELVDDEVFRPTRGAIVPFSGGLDSSHTAAMLARNNEQATLIAIQGLDFKLSETKPWTGYSAMLGRAAHTLDMRLLFAATNWEEVMPQLPGYLGYFAPVVAVPILLSRQFGYAVISSAYPYHQLALPHESNPISDPLLGRPGFPIRHYGAWARRIDKVKAIAAWPELLDNFRPCAASTSDGMACGRCRKCIPTALLFCGLGLPVPQVLGGRTPALEEIERILITPYSMPAYNEAVAAAEERGADEPWLAIIKRRIIAYGRQSSTVAEIDQLKRHTGWLLGNGPRTRFGRYIRRLSRALRGRTAPRDLPSLLHLPYSAVGAGAPKFALSVGGQRLYVDPDDLRGDFLVDEKGAPYPYSLRIWRKLVASAPWTHIVDVGANYGEMLVDTPFPFGARVFAAEPNPFVRPHLERTLREAQLPVEVVANAISDKNGNVELVLDRTWSGLTSVAAPSPRHSDHRLERIAVEATTLRTLLDDGTPNSGKRVLVKIDVEGHETAVLRGLDGDEKTYAEFAAMTEIEHLTRADFAQLLSAFEIELLDLATGAFARVTETSPESIFGLLESGKYYRRDAVLRPRGARSGKSTS